MADTRIVKKLTSKLESATRRAQKAKAQTEIMIERVGETTAAGLGGAMSGLLRAKNMNTVPNTEVELDLVLGGVGAALGVAGIGGKYNAFLLSGANGMLAAALSRQVEAMLK